MPPTPRRTPFLVAIAGALLIAACGGDESAETTTTTAAVETTETTEASETTDTTELRGEVSDLTADDLLDAVERTRSAESGTVRLAMAFDGGSLFGSQEVVAEGSVAFDASRGDLSFATSARDGAIRIVLAEGSGWIGGDVAEVRDALPEDAEWAQVPLADLLAADGFSNPGDLAFLYLVGGAQDIREDGDAVRFAIDLDAAAAAAPDELREEVASTITFDGEQEPDVVGEIEVDDAGRITSMSVLGVQRPTAEEAEHFSIDEDDELRVEIDVTIDGFDEDVAVSAPEGRVVPIAEAPELAAMLGLTPG